jgi:type VI secretion system lysozyme-like protein
MFDRTLTERLEASTADRPYEHRAFDASRLTESVLDSLTRIFNERRGSCETRDDYGMPDLNDVLGGGGTPATLANIIRAMIETFEPRLSAPMVRHVVDPDNPLAVGFRISATLKTEDETTQIAFDTVIAGGSRVRIRS